MAYDENLAERIREELSTIRGIEEKKMMGGLTFMVNGKMCVGVLNDDLMVRIDPNEYEIALQRKGCRAMDFTGRPMKGFVFVNEAGTKSNKDLNSWIAAALAFNKKAKPSKKKKRPKGLPGG